MRDRGDEERSGTEDAGARAEDVVVFLGPSLPEANARAILGPCVIRPPARQGDIVAVLPQRPRIIVLIDGVFEAQPSVWHRELLAAIDAGVIVYGASSMGALRAAELDLHGMRGHGRVYEWYREAIIDDDAEVALLHASAEDGYRALSVPMVNVRHLATAAVEEGVLTRARARAWVEAASNIFYQDRHWGSLLDILTGAEGLRWGEWTAREPLLDLKREDAISCLEAVAGEREELVDAPPEATLSSPSPWLRHARQTQPEAKRVLEALRALGDSEERTEAGIRRQLLASWARSVGLEAQPTWMRSLLGAWMENEGLTDATPGEFFSRLGMDEGEGWALLEEVALETQLVSLSSPWLAEGTSSDEALMNQSRVDGVWRGLSEDVSPEEEIPAPSSRAARKRGGGSSIRK